MRKSDIKQDLLMQLQQKGITNDNGNHYLDLVNDYMFMWDVKSGLIKDIKSRGVTVEWCNGPNQGGVKPNPSIDELKKTNNQMLRILAELDLKVKDFETEEEDMEM